MFANKQSPFRDARLAIACALLALLALAIYICFYDLNSPSIGFRDERTHIQAVQEMRTSGQWWLPTVDGSPYFHKPPFKMWLSFIPVALLGESAFSYRFLDALCGLLTVILTFALAYRLWRSVGAALLSGAAVLGCSSYIFNHGVRTAVQDSMLVFLSTAALSLSWSAAEILKSPAALDRQRLYRLAVAIGLCVGFAALTKNVVGFMPLLILAAFALLDGTLRRLCTEAKGPLTVLLGLSLFIPSCFYVPHCLFTERACSVMFGQEVVDRATQGFHNQSNYLFYLIRVFIDRAAVPPELLAIALAWALLAWVRTRSSRQLFLLCWIAIPFAFFTAAPSRLTWYVAPTFPAMAVLIGGSVAAAWQRLPELWEERPLRRLLAPLLCIFIGLAPLSLARNLLEVSAKLHSLNPRIAMDLLVEDLLAQQKKRPTQSGILRLGAPLCALHERAYCNMIAARSVESYSVEEFVEQLRTGRFGFAFIDSSFFEQIAERAPFKGYSFLAPIYDRNKWLVALNYVDGEPIRSFTKTKQLIDFGGAPIHGVYGWGDSSGSDVKPTFQYLEGSKAAMVLKGDHALKRLGSTLKINLRHDLPKGTLFVVRLNEQEVGRFALGRSDYTSYDLTIAPGSWTAEGNILTFSLEPTAGAATSPLQQPRKLALNFLSISLPEPVH